MGKRGQLTLFVIVGIIILFGVTLIISEGTRSVQERLKAEATADLNEYLKLNSINTYVASCIESVTEDGLRVLGEQGGVIYDYQGGLTNFSQLQEGKDYLVFESIGDELNRSVNVSYGIGSTLTNEDCNNTYSRALINDISIESFSYYPTKGVYLEDYKSKFSKPEIQGGCNGLSPSVYTSGFMGRNLLGSLCTQPIEGATVACRINALNNTNSPVSMQSQIESYIENNILECVDFSLFDFTGNNISFINGSEIDARLIFKKPDGLTANVFFPFQVKVENNLVLTQAEFREDINLNLKRAYYFIYDMIDEFLKNPFLNIERDWNSSKWSNSNLLPIFDLEYIRSPCLLSHKCQFGFYDDVVIVSDKSIYLNGRPFEFIFAVKERAPVLEYMHSPFINSQFTKRSGESVALDFMFNVNQSIIFSKNIMAVDDDNDDLTFSYHGWREDYYTFFDYDKCRTERNICNLSTHQNYMNFVVSTTTGENISPRNWSNFINFNSSLGHSEYRTNNTDIGYHEVTLKVEDEHGYIDFQIIKFLVFDLPTAYLRTFNLYDDVDNDYASVEDIFILDGSQSNESILAGGILENYTFFDSNETFKIHKSENCSGFEDTGLRDVCLEIDLDDKDANYLILPLPFAELNITVEDFLQKQFSPQKLIVTNLSKTLWFDNRSFSFDHLNLPIRHQLSLTVTQTGGIESPASPQDIYVSQCLPHNFEGPVRRVNYPYNFETNIFAYPYNKTEDFSNICCVPQGIEWPFNPIVDNLSWGTFRDSNSVCFEDTGSKMCWPFNASNEVVEFYPLNLSVQEKNSNFADFEDVPNDLYDNLISYPGGSELNLLNDIFKLDFTQKCSGNRGNVCSGRIDVNLIQDESCDDFIIPTQFARCQGPIVSDIQSCQLNAEEPSVCEPYSYPNSFEKKFMLDEQFFSLDYSDYHGKENWIDQGYCADVKSFKIAYSSTPPLSSPGNLDCFGTCFSGECGYFEPNACTCERGDTECKGFNGSSFIDSSRKEYFVCTDDEGINGFCDSTCSYGENKDAFKEACYCANYSVSHGESVKSSNLASFNGFISPINLGDYITIPSSSYPSKCCLDGVFVYKHTTNEMFCADGVVNPSIEDTYSYFGAFGAVLLDDSNNLILCSANPNGWTGIRVSFGFKNAISGKTYECSLGSWTLQP